MWREVGELYGGKTAQNAQAAGETEDFDPPKCRDREHSSHHLRVRSR
jgi:hypothetical protein